MLLLAKPTDITLDSITGVATDVNRIGNYFEIQDSIYVFNQIEWGNEFRLTFTFAIR